MSDQLFPEVPEVIQPISRHEIAERLLLAAMKHDGIMRIVEQEPYEGAIKAINDQLVDAEGTPTRLEAVIFNLLGLVYRNAHHLEEILLRFTMDGKASMELGDRRIAIETPKQMIEALSEARLFYLGPLRALSLAAEPPEDTD